MYYCFKCRRIFDLEWDSFKAERNPEWYPVRKYCPDSSCSGYVYDIDDDMIPIISAILDFAKEAETNSASEFPFTVVTLHSCSGHWNEELSAGYPSVPYIAFALMPKGITDADSEYFKIPENYKLYLESMRELISRGNYPEYAEVNVPPDSQVMWNGFADQNSYEHIADEGWIPVCVSIDHEWIEENLPDIGRSYSTEIDAMMRHYEYQKMFLAVLEAFRDNLKMLNENTIDD